MSEHQAFIIRKAVDGDTDGILSCMGQAFEPYRKDYTPAAFLDTVLTPESIRERLGSMTVFVAVTEAGEVIGTVGCTVLDAEEGHLRGMAVRPEWQGSQVAGQLLETAESDLRARNCSRVTLDTTEPLLRAVRFYEKHGYRPSGKVGDFFGMRVVECVKRLEGNPTRESDGNRQSTVLPDDD